MELTFFQIGKKNIFPQKIQHPSYGFHMTLAFIFNVNKNVTQVNNYKDIEFFSHELIDIALEAGQSIG